MQTAVKNLFLLISISGSQKIGRECVCVCVCV